MKSLSLTALISFTLWVACTQAPQAPKAETSEPQATPSTSGNTITISPQNSKVLAIGTKVTGRHEIIFPIKSGELSLDSTGCISGGKVILDLNGLQVTDLKGDLKTKLESHLRSEDFFLTSQYPEGSFEITGCEKRAGDTILLSGNLSLRGQTKNIKFPAVLHYTQPKTLHAVANFNINRQDWGIAYKGKADDLIRDEVNIQLEIRSQ
ncbi:MAG: YceI family protein [Bacteroidia bacterium]|nr:YceI family protein [Bacteroidia bacterium]MDW8416330.1 YceI family protein [Bacteroidia bacterium]